MIYIRSVKYLQNVKYGSCMLLVACFFFPYIDDLISWYLRLDSIFLCRPSLLSRKEHTCWSMGVEESQSFVHLGYPMWALFGLSNLTVFLCLYNPLAYMVYFILFLAPSGWICTDMVLRERRETSKVEPCIQDNSWATDCKLMFFGGLDSFSRRLSCLAISP